MINNSKPPFYHALLAMIEGRSRMTIKPENSPPVIFQGRYGDENIQAWRAFIFHHPKDLVAIWIDNNFGHLLEKEVPKQQK